MNSTALGGDVPTVTSWTGPPRPLVRVQALLYASLAASLFSASLAMFGKRWLNLYASVDMRGSAIERSQNRQRKVDGFVAWRFVGAVESLSLMLQIALLLLGSALANYLWDIDVTIASVVLSATVFGVIFYAFIVVAGAFSMSCPYQTFGARVLRSLWRKVRNPFHTNGHTLGPARALDGEVTILDFGCISWMLRTSLDRTINELTLKFLGSVLTHPGFNDGVVADCLNVVINYVSVADDGQVVVTRGSERLAEMGAVCLLRALSHRLVEEPIPVVPGGLYQWLKGVQRGLYQRYKSVPGDLCQRYKSVFPSMDALSNLPFYHTITAAHSLITGDSPDHLNWDGVDPSTPESLWLAHNFVKIAWYQKNKNFGPGNDDRVDHWILCFSRHYLSLDSELPLPVIADCLSITAIELGCNISRSDVMDQDKRYVP